MKNLIIILLFLLFYLKGYSQEKYTQDPGKVTQYEMTLKEYPEDPDAEALVIYDMGEYFFSGREDRGLLLFMKRKMKLKILKQAGVKYATFEIPYYSEDHDWEAIESIDATTYNYVDGTLTKSVLNSKNIFEEKISEKVKVKKITMPDVREGSVVEIAYTISTPYYFNMRKWEFQKKIPVVYSKLRYRAIPYYEYAYIAKGIQKFDEFKSEAQNEEIRFGQLLYREMIYDFGMKNISAFKDEEYITSEKDYMASLDFQMSKINYPTGGSKQIITTWPEMCDDFLKDGDFGKYIQNSEKEAKKILPTLNLTGKSQIDQVEIISDYVKSKYNWNGIYGKYANSKLSDFLKQQTGNVANINLFLTGLLKAAGLEVYPVVLSTRKNGMISEGHPFQHFFNYVISEVKIDNQVYFIDATEPLLDFKNLPSRSINVKGLVVKPKSGEWVGIRQNNISTIQHNFDLTINPEENSSEVKAMYISLGEDAYIFRSNYLGKEENLQKYLKDQYKIDADSVSITATPLDKPFIFSFLFKHPVETSGDKIFIHPFCNLSIDDNPFKQTKRTLPVDLTYLRSRTYKSVITIPKGYKIEHLPKPYAINDNLISMNYSVVNNSDQILVEASYAFKQNMYDAKNYLSLKMSFADIIKQLSEMIVLVKE